jgi:hypothetical protein
MENVYAVCNLMLRKLIERWMERETDLSRGKTLKLCFVSDMGIMRTENIKL